MTAPGGARRLRAVVGPYTALRLIGQAFEFVGFVVLARKLEPTAFGQLTIAFLICRYAGVIGDWGALTRGARDVVSAGRHGSVRAYVRKRDRVTLLTAAITAAAMVMLGFPALLPTIAVVFNIGCSRDWISLGRERGARAAVPTALQGALVLAGSLFATTAAGGAIVVAVGYGLPLVLSLALNSVRGEPVDRGVRGPDAWILLAFLAVQVTSSIDAPLLGAIKGAADAGIYGAIYRLPNAWIAVLTAIVGGALPSFTLTAYEGVDALRRLRRRALRLSGLASLAMIAAAPIVYFAVPIVFGSDYDAGQWPAVVLILANAVITFGAPLHILAVAGGNDRGYAMRVGAGAILNVALNLLLIPSIGIIGAASATLVAQVVITGLLWRSTAVDVRAAVVNEPGA